MKMSSEHIDVLCIEAHLSRKLLLSIVSIMALVVMLGCGSTQSPTSTPTPTPTTTNQQPIEIVSVLGPLAPFNPGGPTVEIILKNVSTTPIVSLTATLGLGGVGHPTAPGSFTFTFDVTALHPLLPGRSVSDTSTLIGAGFSDSASYPLTITGTMENGATFTYTKQVHIVG
jgi:hypothetical protein